MLQFHLNFCNFTQKQSIHSQQSYINPFSISPTNSGHMSNEFKFLNKSTWFSLPYGQKELPQKEKLPSSESSPAVWKKIFPSDFPFLNICLSLSHFPTLWNVFPFFPLFTFPHRVKFKAEIRRRTNMAAYKCNCL